MASLPRCAITWLRACLSAWAFLYAHHPFHSGGGGAFAALTEADYELIGLEQATRRAAYNDYYADATGTGTDKQTRSIKSTAVEEARRRLSETTMMHETNRTAILLSGQLRSSNLTWSGGQIRRNRESTMFGPGDPPSPAACIIKFLFESLDKQGGGFDVFMYLTAKSTAKTNEWNGNPLFFEPTPGDTTACKVFSDDPIFHGTGHRFFCLVEPEVQLMTPWMRNYTMWQSRPGGYNSEVYNEQALQQYYGSYRANTASKEFALANRFKYKYKIRLRPDTPLTRVFPQLSAFNFGPTANKPCKSTVYYPNKMVGGHNDYFNVGLTADMDRLLDRYLDFTQTLFDKWLTRRAYWDLEDHLEAVLMLKYEICLEWFVELWVVVIRPVPHYKENWQPEPIKFHWAELSSR